MPRHATLRLHPGLTAMLNGLDDTEFGDEFRRNAVTLSTQLLTEPVVNRRTALTPHLWLLERAQGDGIPLTAAGYLKPADARELAALLPSMREYPWAGTREVDAHPIMTFRGHLQAIGLLRRYKGTLRQSRLGRQCATDVDALWRHLADTLIPDATAFEEHCSVTLLVYCAATHRTARPARIARILTAHGWRHPGGADIDERDVYPVWNALWASISAVGEPGEPETREFLPRVPGVAARALARDALFEVVADSPVAGATESRTADAGAAFRRGSFRPVPPR